MRFSVSGKGGGEKEDSRRKGSVMGKRGEHHD